jgi:hypothetical protein
MSFGQLVRSHARRAQLGAAGIVVVRFQIEKDRSRLAEPIVDCCKCRSTTSLASCIGFAAYNRIATGCGPFLNTFVGVAVMSRLDLFLIPLAALSVLPPAALAQDSPKADSGGASREALLPQDCHPAPKPLAVPASDAAKPVTINLRIPAGTPLRVALERKSASAHRANPCTGKLSKLCTRSISRSFLRAAQLPATSRNSNRLRNGGAFKPTRMGISPQLATII